jgi:hypothetical protein
VVELGPAEVVGLPVGVVPDPDPLLERAVPVGLFLDDVEDLVVVELHRRVVPDAGHLAAFAPDAGGFGLADRPDAPGPVPHAPPGLGLDGEGLAGDLEGPGPAAVLAEPGGVEGQAAEVADLLLGLLERGVGALEGHVQRQGVLGGLEDEADLLQRLHHLDPQRAGGQVHPVVELPAGAHDPVLVAPADDGEGVLGAKVRVEAEPQHEEEVARAVVGVEVVAVVEVAVAGPDVADGFRDLVDREVVAGREHVLSP